MQRLRGNAMNEVSFTLEGNPVAKQSFKINKKIGGSYKDKKMAAYEAYVKEIAILAMIGKEVIHKDHPCYVRITVFVNKTQKDISRYYPIVKPDLDNVSKGILDALNKVVYYDDKQVVDLVVSRRFTTTRDYVSVKVMWEDL